MPSRGYLIHPFTAKIGRLDTVKTRAHDPAGTVASGYDDVFREPVVTTDGAERKEARQETVVCAPCQVEDATHKMLVQGPGGDSPSNRIALVFHFQDLERLGLVDTTSKQPRIRPRDRLISLHILCSGKLEQTFDEEPGWYCVESKPAGFGLGGRRNLLICTFQERERGNQV